MVPASTNVARAATSAGDDTVFTFGSAGFYGSTAGKPLAQPLVGMANTPDGKGYWLVASDGGIFSYGSAHFYGSTGAIRLNQPIVGMNAAPDGKGYWLVARDGGVFTFGSAHFYGSTGAMRLNQPIIGMAPASDGKGYWLVASDGGIFSFGSAKFHGSTGAIRLNAPVMGMAAAPDGKGYWLVASDGGIFSFGSAKFRGSTGAIHLNKPVVGMAATGTGAGYWLAAEDGGVFTFGDAKFQGSAAGRVPFSRRVSQIAGLKNGTGYRLLAIPLPLNTPVLAEGASGVAVTQLQVRLIQLGYWIDAANGSYGLTTTQAVTAFQKLHNMPRTGVFDLATQGVLNSASRPSARSTSGYVMEVDKTHQVILVTSNGAVQWVINTSTGGGYQYTFGGQTFTATTPEGHFNIWYQVDGLQMGRLGALWRPKYFTHDGVAFHGYPHVPSYPASHGCVRMTNAAIDWVWNNNIMPMGTAVWVYS
ncbi:MAG: hypothetical protein JWL83_48 [Actinomycetia bacterium]|nr:hypothetical protein [Actinomycetes bacterium]